MVCFILAGVFLILSILQFKKVGVPINNQYKWSSPAEKERLDVDGLFRQSAVVFLLSAIDLVFVGLSMITGLTVMTVIAILLIVFIFIYAIVTSL